jgi:hypothetical protein
MSTNTMTSQARAEERQVLRAVGVGADDHASCPVRAGGCDCEGRGHCAVRAGEMRACRRAGALIGSVAEQTALRDLAVWPRMFVTCWHGSRASGAVDGPACWRSGRRQAGRE